MFRWSVVAAAVVFSLFVVESRADIYRWDDGQLIAGTEGIEPSPEVDLSAMNLQYADLAGANLRMSTLNDTDLRHADLTDASLSFTQAVRANFGIATLVQANFSQAKLEGAVLSGGDASGANFQGADLSSAKLDYTALASADFTNATVRSASLERSQLRGFTIEQLYSTASYKDGDLGGINLARNDFSGADFTNQRMPNSSWTLATLTSAQFSGAVLSNAWLQSTVLRNAKLRFADLRGAKMGSTKLDGADLSFADLSSTWFDVSQFNGASFYSASLMKSDINPAPNSQGDARFVDLRGAWGFPIAPMFLDAPGAIRPNGEIAGLEIRDTDIFLLRDYADDPAHPAPISSIFVKDSFTMHDGGVLRFQFDADAWDSTLRFEEGVPVHLGGQLEFTFVADVELASQIGSSFQLFDWSGVSPTGTFLFADEDSWDVSQIYSLGIVTYLGAPLPGDANGDRAVDLTDLNLVRNHFGDTGERPEGDTYPFDGVVDLADLNAVRNHFGEQGGARPAPEPATFALVLASAAAIWGGRSRFALLGSQFKWNRGGWFCERLS